MYLLLLLLLASVSSAQQPFLYYGGAYHAATYSPAGLPNSGLPRGGLFTVFGRNLGPAAPATANAFPLSTNLSGVRLQVLKGTQTFDAYPVFVSATQINAILPSNTPNGKAVLRLQFNTATSNIIPVEIVQSNFGTFSINSAGFGPAIVTNFIAQDNQPINSLEQAAQPGQVITIWGSGLGPVAFPDNVAPTAGDVTNDVTIYIGGLPAQRIYAGRAPCCAGLDQIVVTIPPNVPQSCWVPIQVRAGGITSNSTTIAIASNATACSDLQSPLSNVIRKGGKLARLLTTRSVTRVDVAIPTPINITLDTAMAQFAEYSANPFAWQLFDSLPPAGTCITFTNRGISQQLTTALAGLNGAPLDPGGPLSVQGLINATMNKFQNLTNLFGATLGTGSQLFFPLNREISITSSGSPAVPAFAARTTPNLTAPWTNRDAAFRFPTNQPIQMNWAPQPGGLILAVGTSFRVPANASGLFACAAQSEDGRITVPSYIVSSLPKEAQPISAPSAILSLVFVPNPSGTPITIPGFEASVNHINVQARTVQFR